MNQKILNSEKVTLRPFHLDDAKEVQKLAGHPKIAETTLNVPHPYEDGMAEWWINTHEKLFTEGYGMTYAVIENSENNLVGCIGLGIDKDNKKAELGYWIGFDYWNKGYASEATRLLFRYAFEEFDINKIHSSFFAENIGSGRVMEKMGMRYEGLLREDVIKNNKFVDLKRYSILKSEYLK